MMTKFMFNAAVAVRAYGTITVEAETIEEAKALIQEPTFEMSKRFEPHGGGEDDFDFDYHKPAVYLFNVVVNDDTVIDLEEDLLDTQEEI